MAKLKAISRQIVAQRGPSEAKAPLGLTAAPAEAAQALAGAASDEIGQFQAAAREAEVRHGNRRDAVSRVTAYGGFLESTTAELRRLETEDDLSSKDASRGYLEFVDAEKRRILADHDGSPESKLLLAERLELEGISATQELGSAVFAAQQKRMGEGMDREVRALSKAAGEAPDSVNELFTSLDRTLQDMASALTPEQEESFRVAGRQQVLMSAVTGALSRGNVPAVRQLLAFPGAAEMLSPEQQRKVLGAVNAEDAKRRKVADDARAKLEGAEIILGRPLTASERVRLSGVAPPAGQQTISQKIQEAEAALGRPLTDEERERFAGLEVPGAQTDPGKVIQDRERFIGQFGEGSPQVQAFDEMIDAEGDAEPPSLSDVGGVRKEFTGLSKDFVMVRDSFGRIKDTAASPSAAGDLSLIFNFMKMLDPGSTVREGEFATAQNAAGVPERVRNTLNRILSGERLGDTQRADFLAQSENLMGVMLRAQLQLEKQFSGIATRQKMASEDVVIDFIGDLRDASTDDDATGAAPTGGDETDDEPPPIEFDLSGKRISK